MDFDNRRDEHRLELPWPEHWGEQRLWPPAATLSISDETVIGGASSMTDASFSDERRANSRERAMFLEAAAMGKTRRLGEYLTSWNRLQIINQWRNEQGMNALHLSALGGHLSCTRRLLLELAPVDSEDYEKATPLMFAALGGHIKVLDMLIKNGALLGRPDADGRTALFYAVAGSQRPLVKHLLQKWRPDCTDFVRRMDNYGFTALYYALNQYDLKMACLLVEHGARVDGHWLCEASLPLVERKTALMYAAECNDLESLGYFLHAGANPNAVRWTFMVPQVRPARDAELEKSASLADKVRSSQGMSGKTALMYAAENASLACVDALLRLPLHNSVNLNAQDEHGATPLMYAIRSGNEEIIELLLRRGADPTIQDVHAMSSLSAALCSGTSSRVLELLVNFGCPGYKPGVKLYDPLYVKTPWTTVYLLGLGAPVLPPTRPMPPAMQMPAMTQPPPPWGNDSAESLDAPHVPPVAHDGIKTLAEGDSGHPVESRRADVSDSCESLIEHQSNPSKPLNPPNLSNGRRVTANGQPVQQSSSQIDLAWQVAEALDVLFAVTAMPHLSRPSPTPRPDPLLISSALGAVLALPDLLRRDQSGQELMPPPPPKQATFAQASSLERIGAWRPGEELPYDHEEEGEPLDGF